MKQLLLVAETTLLRTGLKVIAQKHFHGCTVTHAETYGQVTGWLANHSDACMILEIPHFNREDALPALVAARLRHRCPVIVILEDYEALYPYFYMGVEGIVYKDCSPSEMAEAMRAVSKGKRYYSHTVSQALIATHLKGHNVKGTLTVREPAVLYFANKGYTNRTICTLLELSRPSIARLKQAASQKLSILLRDQSAGISSLLPA